MSLLLITILFAPFVVPAIATMIITPRMRARRERLAARAQIGRLP